MGSVKLIHSTPNGEELIAYMARVSNPNNQSNPSYDRLIQYLIKHKHWSPFEMVNLCMEIETTRSVAAQILRHRSFSFQEFSQRYSTVTDLPEVPDFRRQDVTNRQNSYDGIDETTKEEFRIRTKFLFESCRALYKEMLSAGVAKECARDILPMATPTKLYMNGTLRSWLHYCDLRCGNGTQKEHKDIADQCKAVIADKFPSVFNAMWSYGSL